MSIYFLDSCYYDNGDELLVTCDTSIYNYSDVIVPLMDHYCISCHNNTTTNAGVSVEGYDNVKQLVDAGVLLPVIRHESGWPAMPKDAPQMLPCDIRNIELWVADGAPNN